MSEDTDATIERPGLFRRLLQACVLPKTISAFEKSYLERMNKVALGFFYAHLPIFLLISWVNDTDPLFTLLLTASVLMVPFFGCRAFTSQRSKSLVFGFTSMCMGGILVHIGQGPVQIEMHFYFFSVLAMLALFANPMVIIVAAVTVALHHLVLWYLVPQSVFNYDAPIWVVLVHAGFVVLETFAACFIARNFFDNVIGLEKKVEARTAEIRKRNEDMRLVLDNVRQGLVTINRDGSLCAEHSKALTEWFGDYEAGEAFSGYMARGNQEFGDWWAICWEGVVDGFLPAELALDQLPKTAKFGERHVTFDYQPIHDDAGEIEKMMIVVTDVTADVAQQEAESRQREILVLFERILADRNGFVDFYEEASRLVEASSPTAGDDVAALKRSVHTLKGNTSLFGVDSVAKLCHELEERMAEGDDVAANSTYETLKDRWVSLTSTVDRMLGHREQDDVTITGDDYRALLGKVVAGTDHPEIARFLVDLALEPTEVRLNRFAEQARALADRLEKGSIEVEIDANDVRIERARFQQFWSAFTHVLRNAIDHGIESPDQRSEVGKPDVAHLDLRTFEENDEVVVEVKDDGRGIDWDGVRDRAQERGLPCETDQDLVQALFAAGLSTRDDVSDTSGRGVGLAAVREACDALGGRIKTISQPGSGTTFQFRFPSAVAKNDDALTTA
jgi:two-component system chemotaxis sensor kinase CheA